MSPSPLGSEHGPLSNISATLPAHFISWSVTLQELKCHSLPDSKGRRPYIWPVIISFDDNTKDTPVRVGITGPLMQDVSVPLTEEMHAGDTVAIPATVGHVGTYTFQDIGSTDAVPNSLGRNLVLVVALFEHNDSFEQHVIAAGYTAFQSALQEAFGENLSSLLLAINSAIANHQDPTTDEGVQSIEQQIKNSVTDAVTSAFTNALPDGTELIFSFTKDTLIDAGIAPPGIFHDVKSTTDIKNFFLQLGDLTQYQVAGQLQVGTAVASPGLPFDCAGGGPFAAIKRGSLNGEEISDDQEDGDAFLDDVSQSKLGLTSRHGGIAINKVGQSSVVVLTACRSVRIDDKIDNRSHATIVTRRGDVIFGKLDSDGNLFNSNGDPSQPFGTIDQNSTADISSGGAIVIVQKIDQHSVARLSAKTNVHIGQKIDNRSTVTIIADGDINIDHGIDQHSTAFITSLFGSITIGKDKDSGAVDGHSVVTLRAPNGNITIRQKVAGGAIVNVTLENFTSPDTSGGKINPLLPFPPLP